VNAKLRRKSTRGQEISRKKKERERKESRVSGGEKTTFVRNREADLNPHYEYPADCSFPCCHDSQLLLLQTNFIILRPGSVFFHTYLLPKWEGKGREWVFSILCFHRGEYQTSDPFYLLAPPRLICCLLASTVRSAGQSHLLSLRRHPVTRPPRALP
jgi:hypothetical protein